MSRRALLALCVAVAALVAPPAALAEISAPGFSLHAFAIPTSFAPADSAACLARGVNLAPAQTYCDTYQLTAKNAGAAATDGSPIRLEDTLPPVGLTVRRIAFERFGATAAGVETLPQADCSLASVSCEATLVLAPGEVLQMTIYVTTAEGLTGPLLTEATVQGGGAPLVETSLSNPLESLPPFGLAGFLSPFLGEEGTPTAQAGSHPASLQTRIDLNSVVNRQVPGGTGNETTAVEDLRDAVVDLPPGLAGSALSAPRCTLARLAGNPSTEEEAHCPRSTIVGHLFSQPIGVASVLSPIYNLVPERGVAAEFGYVDTLATTHVLFASLAPSPEGYVLRTTSPQIPQVPLTNIEADFFGNPAARDETGEEEVPTFTMPSDCSGEPLTTTVHVDSWVHPGARLPDGEPDFSDPNWASASYQQAPVSGCNKLAGLFNPTIEAQPTTTQGDKPSGLEVTLKVPQHELAGNLAPPPLKKAVVTLPQGMSVNPSSANGLEGCSLAQIGVSASGQPNGEPVRCPDASKLGSLELRTPALPGTLEGQIYVAKQTENPFNSLLAIYLVVDDPTTGVLVKIPGEVRADPQTGQLTTVIDNSPQFPFSELTTKFFGGQKAALRTPAVCGSYEVSASLTPWSAPESGPPATPSGSFQINQNCAPSAAQLPNGPSFAAGTENPLAGAYSPFGLELERQDGSQEVSGLSLTLPEGLLGKLAGISECPESSLALAASREHEGGGAEELASPSCPQASEVGSVTVAAGAGLAPYYTTGKAYLAGPYKGAPLSLAIVTPAVAGPYDLGDVVVRTALQVDPYTAQITAVSDPIPHILQGIPLDVRSISLRMSRSNFTLNPTNCEAMTIAGSATSVLGQSAPLSNRFQVGGCKGLGFKPKLQLSLKGGTTRAKHPALKAVLTYPNGSYANIASAQVGLPHSEFLDQGNLDNVCTQPQLASRTCPPSSVYGRVKAWSPLLEQPLEGNVYLGVGFGHLLPDLVGELNGQIRVLIHGKVDTDKEDGIRNTFETVPDAPVSKFVLELEGGRKKGLLRNSESLCRKPQRATAKFVGQNGKVSVLHPLIANDCGKKQRHHAKKRRTSRRP